MNNYTTDNFCIKFIIFLDKTYQDSNISSGTLYNQNGSYLSIIQSKRTLLDIIYCRNLKH